MSREVWLGVLIGAVLLAVVRCATPSRGVVADSLMPIVSPPAAEDRDFRPSYCTNPIARHEARCKSTAVKWM
jgi:hypothetical protein